MGMSVVRLLVLGAIKRRGVAHGYRIYSDLREWRAETWTTVRPGSIYHAIAQLEKQGFVEAIDNQTSQKLGPAKTEYRLTLQGDHECIDLLEKALADINIVELSVGIAFMEYLSRQRVVELLEKRLSAQEQLATFLKALPTDALPSTPSRHPELIRIWSDSYMSAAVSTQKLISSIQSGKYVFKTRRCDYEKYYSNTARRQ